MLQAPWHEYTMDFVTMGMFIMDELHYQPPKTPDLNVMGGAGLYAALGARLFRPPPSSSRVGWTIHEGHDFPLHMKNTIDAWNTSCQFISTPDRATTRAFNEYEPSGYRSFRYLNEKIRVDQDCLTMEQLMSKTYHLICSANRCISLIQGIKRKRRELAKGHPSTEQIRTALMEEPIFVWEPFPDLCKPSEFGRFLEALDHVDVFSPNLEEFCNLLSIKIDLERPAGWELLREECTKLFGSSNGRSEKALVIRLGEKGCFIAQHNGCMSLPAYHEQNAASRVVDPTGGGNTFLGGFCIGVSQFAGMSPTEKFKEAALYGAVAASFAIEQVGMPTLQPLASNEELWNADYVQRRLKMFRERVTKQTDQARES
ncbi:MAG: hypothetical protein Q9184_001835 [Pyrenodesmia sp. 2 TL-2023]